MYHPKHDSNRPQGNRKARFARNILQGEETRPYEQFLSQRTHSDFMCSLNNFLSKNCRGWPTKDNTTIHVHIRGI